MLLALTRGVSDSLAACELTHLRRTPLDIRLAQEQHGRYEAALRRAGCRVVSLPPLHEFPDAVFVEDVAVVLDEIAIITRPGAESRRDETASVAAALKAWRPVVRIEDPGTLEGGDILRLGRRIFAGRSGRTNDAGISQLAALTAPYGYVVIPVPVSGCLHLKSAVTEVAPGTILANRDWVDPAVFGDVNVIDVDPGEPYAANAVSFARSPGPLVRGPGPFVRAPEPLVRTPGPLVRAPEPFVRSPGPMVRAPGPLVRSPGPMVRAPGPLVRSPGPSGPGTPATIYPSSFPRTRRLLESCGIALDIVDVSELQKAEGAVTCCSVVFRG